MAGTPRLTFKVHGLDCAEEVALLKGALRPLVNSLDQLQFDILAGKLSIQDMEAGRETAVQQAIAGTGMKAVPWAQYIDETKQPGGRTRDPRLLFTAASGAAFFAAFALHTAVAGFGEAFTASLFDGLRTDTGGFAAPLAAAGGLYLLAILTGARYILPKAWIAFKALRPDMNLLLVVAVSGALALGHWQEAALVTFLFAVALLLESWSVARARGAITRLMDLAPDTARIVRTPCGCEHPEGRECPVAEVGVGAEILVKPGERIPLDGEIRSGETSVNQAPITGEATPVEKGPGDAVFAGTVNQDGAIVFRATKDADHSSLARIIHLVEEAQSRRAPSEQFVEAFARYYTPAMVGAAIAIALAAPLFFGVAWTSAVYLACVVLLIACPCALVISTPVSIVAGIAAAARNGVLIKGGAFLEAPARVRAIAFDKTGTLTRGAPAVRGITPLDGRDARDILRIAASLEAHSTHPLAAAILKHAIEENVPIVPAAAHQALPGRGAAGDVDGESFWIGNRTLVRERTGDDRHAATEEAESGLTSVAVGNHGAVLGTITLSDTPRDQARGAVEALRAAGIGEIVLLTGDNEGAARRLAEATGVDSYRAELLPEQKVAAIEELKARHGAVCMVGDGINDAPALAAADVSIAMGAAGSDAAIDAADIALMSDDLTRLPWLLHHSRRTLAIIKQNIAFSLGLKAAVFLLALGGFASLWLAIAADMGASLIVIANALRLLR